MRKNVLRCFTAFAMATLLLVTAGCTVNIDINSNPEGGKTTSGLVEETAENQISYSYATKEEGIDMLMSNEEYYAGFSQNELEFKFQKKDADMESYLEFAREQVLDFTDEEKEIIDEYMASIEAVLSDNGYVLPELDPIILINTTQQEEPGAAAYTHGTQIYLNAEEFTRPELREWGRETMAHELFHCLTRSNPDFRKEMYKLINFTVQDDDFKMPPSVLEYYISNPDVEHHNSYATFTIDGEPVDCFAALVTTRHFEKPGDSFFKCMTTALVPVDGSDKYYTPEDTSDFYDVFGRNTGYVIDPEECMADNFARAVTYGMDGPKGEGYETPEIIKGIIEYLKGGSGSDSEGSVAGPEIDTSVMKPWINSNILGLVTDDVNADLRDDYYLNVDHDYLRDARLKPGYPSTMPIIQAIDDVEARCLDILNDESLTGRDAQMVQDCYELYLDWDGRNEAGIDPLIPYVRGLEAVDSIDKMTEFILSDVYFDFGSKFQRVSVGASANDSSRYEVKIEATPLMLEDSAEYKELTGNGKREKEYNTGLISYMLGRVGYSEDEINDILDEAFGFEEKIAKYEMTTLEKTDPDTLKKMINPVSMEDLKKISPDYPITEYLEKWGYSDSELINLQEPRWLEGLNGLYKEGNLEGIKAYALTHTMATYVGLTDEEAYRKYQEFRNAKNGISESLPDEEAAYQMARSLFANNMARIYIDRYLTEEMRDEIRQMCQDSIDTYKDMLDEIDWLSEKTKEQAKYKLEHITINALYPDKWEDDSMFFVTSKKDGGSFLQTILDYNRARHELDLSHINGKIDREIWTVDILDTNAYYNPEENSINIIPGFFCDATYSSDMSVEEKYGALGSVIGHEISHAFDTDGAQYDAEGNVRNWWTDEDMAAFMERAGKLVDYYDKVVAFDDGTEYRGQMVQTEAIADMAGLKCMLKMAGKIEGFDYDKFFRAHAYLWGYVGSEEYLEYIVSVDTHPLHYLRCNVSVQQFDEFYDTYDIKEGDGMYLAPEDRIAVW